MTRDTVDRETPAAAATISSVGALVGLLSVIPCVPLSAPG
jgi:hypothetical protein